MGKIRVLIGEDSSFLQKTVEKMLSEDPEIEVVGVGINGKETIEKTISLKPDVVVLDVIMPMSDGLWALEEIMKRCPTPVILFNVATKEASEVTIEALKLGAINVVPRPISTNALWLTKNELVQKVKVAAQIDRQKLFTLFQEQSRKSGYLAPPLFPARQVVTIGASAGGPSALLSLVGKMPKNMSAGMLVAQHMPASFVKSFAEHLSTICLLPVKLAEAGDFVTMGRLLFCPGEMSVKIEKLKRGGIVVFDLSKSEHGVLPSIDLLMGSAAKVYGSQTIGVLLSGMGRDGVKGLKAIKEAGGKTIVQDETSSVVYGMAKEAINAGVVDKILPLDKIADEIVKILE